MARHGRPCRERYPPLQRRAARLGTAALAFQVGAGQVVASPGGRRLASLANAYSVEHGILAAPATDVAEGLGAILGEILGELPRWDVIALDELDPRDPAYHAAVTALRRAGSSSNAGFIREPGSKKPPG